MVRLFESPVVNHNLFRVPQSAESQHAPLVEMVPPTDAPGGSRGASGLPQASAAAFPSLTQLPTHQPGYLPLMTSSLPVGSPSGYRSASKVYQNMQPPVDLKSLVFDHISVHVWATRHNRLLLLDGPDVADTVSLRGSVRVLKDAAQLYCEERGIVMEQLRPSDIASVHMHASSRSGEGGGGNFSWTVAVHAHGLSPGDTYLEQNGFVRRLPNGVVLKGAQSTPQRHAAATWATVAVVCPNKDVAMRLRDALESLRIRYLQSVPHGNVPEAGVAESAVVLQHRAREFIARSGLRPDGVTLMAPPAAALRGATTPLSHKPLMIGNATPPTSGLSTPSPRSAAQGGSKRAAHEGGALSLLTSIPRSPFDASPADAYEVLLGSDDEDGEQSECMFQFGDDDAPSSSTSSVVSSDEDEDRAAVIRHVFNDPFVPIKRELQHILGPSGTWGPHQALQIPLQDQQHEQQHQSEPPSRPVHAPSVSEDTMPPSPTRLQENEDGKQRGHGGGELPLRTSQRSSQSSEEAGRGVVHHQNRRSSDHDPFQHPKTAPGPSDTERRTQALIEKLRADFIKAHQQEHSHQQPFIPGAPSTMGPNGRALMSPEPSMLLDGPPAQQPPSGFRPSASDNSPSREKNRPKPLLQVLRRDTVDNDDSDTESLQFQEEQATGLQSTVSPVKSDETRRHPRGPTPTKRSTPPKTSGASDGPRLARVMSAAATAGLNKSPNRSGHRPDKAIDEAIGVDDRGHQQQRPNVAGSSKNLRRSPVIASARFQLHPSTDAAALQQSQATRLGSATPTRSSGGRGGRVDESPERDELPQPSASDFGAVEHSLAIVPSTSDPSSRRCRWCKNVAPESHDDRCAMRKIRCKKCQQVLLLKERNAHHC